MGAMVRGWIAGMARSYEPAFNHDINHSSCCFF